MLTDHCQPGLAFCCGAVLWPVSSWCGLMLVWCTGVVHARVYCHCHWPLQLPSGCTGLMLLWCTGVVHCYTVSVTFFTHWPLQLSSLCTLLTAVHWPVHCHCHLVHSLATVKLMWPCAVVHCHCHLLQSPSSFTGHCVVCGVVWSRRWWGVAQS